MAIVARNSALLAKLLEKQQEDCQPTHVEGNMENTIPLYNLHEHKAHLQMEKGSAEVKISLVNCRVHPNL